MNSNLISKAVRYALIAGAASAAPAAFAADQAAATTTSSDTSTAQLGKIEVTGTRIKRTSVETAQPITVVTSAQIKASGFANIGDVLQNVTAAGSAVNNQVNNGNAGFVEMDLRNLGAQRVLVLVNGKRWVPDLDNTVDLLTIPATVIDHVEILQDGASAIYGSDAIAGVVNIITVKNFNGAEADAFIGEFHGDGHTDGRKQQYDFTLGSSSDKSSVVMNVSYTNEQGLFAGDRTMSKEAIWGVGGGSSAIPGGRFIINNAAICSAMPGVTLKATKKGGPLTECDVTLINPGATPTPNATTAWHDFKFSRDSFNYAPLNYLLIPSERTALYVQGHYDIADNLTFTSEVLFNNRESAQQLAPEPLFLGEQAQGETNQGVNIGVGAANPYNPFGVDLVPYAVGTPSFTSWCNAYGSANCLTTGVELVSMRRRPIDPAVGNRVQLQNFDTFHWSGGFKGYFNMLGNEWDWDVSGAYSLNYLNQALTGDFDTGEIQNALSNACPSTAGCVPLNLFGGAGPAGNTITAAQAASIGFEGHDINRQDVRNYTANIAGDLFDLPAGPVGLAMGYEYLEQTGFNHPDALISLNLTTGNAQKPTDGREATNAEYLEFNIPLVADAPFMKDVSLDLADRFSQFKWGGVGQGQVFVPGADHASTARWALRWQVNDDLLIRGSWSQGFRIPSISEFYVGVNNNFPAVSDPCAVGNAGGAFCTANGHPTIVKQASGQINTLDGGNPALTPEKSISKTVGFVYNPASLPGFDVSVDYYDISLVNTIATLGPQNILNGCYQGNVQSYCKLIQIVGNQVNQIINTNTNVGSTVTDGFDISTHYKFPSTSAGDFKLGLDLNILKRFNHTVPNATVPGGYAVSQLAGWSVPTAPLSTTPGSGATYPKKHATLSLDWHYGDWSAMWTMFYIDHTVEPCINGTASPTTLLAACTYNFNATNAAAYLASFNKPLPDNGPAQSWSPQGHTAFLAQNHIGSTTYHDVEVTYHQDSWNTDFTFGIQNLFGKHPPSGISAFANTYYPFYNRVPGQFFYGRLSVKF
ncbi:MAG TPA: TonB-dependent receptor [Gammaproteobacteria bacterium]|nr:TonB-dependent receptor [Gammaproteobacteria bacterium]